MNSPISTSNALPLSYSETRCRPFNPLQPNISIHFLHNVLCTFPMVLTKRICLTIKSVFSW